jgi:hypothetical protein
MVRDAMLRIAPHHEAGKEQRDSEGAAMQKELLIAVLGLALGIGLSMLLRKYFPSLRRGPKPKPVPPPASRQEARRRERQAEKKNR